MTDVKRDTPPVPERLAGWLGRAVEAGASDLHLIPGYPPVLRLHGDLTELHEPVVDGAGLSPLLSALLPAAARDRLQANKSVDYSFDLTVGGEGRRARA